MTWNPILLHDSAVTQSSSFTTHLTPTSPVITFGSGINWPSDGISSKLLFLDLCPFSLLIRFWTMSSQTSPSLYKSTMFSMLKTLARFRLSVPDIIDGLEQSIVAFKTTHRGRRYLFLGRKHDSFKNCADILTYRVDDVFSCEQPAKEGLFPWALLRSKLSYVTIYTAIHQNRMQPRAPRMKTTTVVRRWLHMRTDREKTVRFQKIAVKNGR